jgi:putative FmdB family regulatory protein
MFWNIDTIYIKYFVIILKFYVKILNSIIGLLSREENMALIDLKCENCGNSFFEIVKNAEEKIVCPNCGSYDTKRIYKGKFYGKGGGCSGGSCSGCSGCSH